MSTMATSFLYCLPSTEEEMIDIARETIRQDKSRQNYLDTIENLEQLVLVMKDHLTKCDQKKGDRNAD